jgi:hypothetical protein
MDVRTVTPDPRLLHSTAAVSVANGVIGAPNGSAGDTVLFNVTILKNAGPATLTIAGFRGEDATARNILLTGSATVDTQYSFPGLRNTGAAMTLTASVADVVLVAVTGA